jgi:hypothetical protein
MRHRTRPVPVSVPGPEGTRMPPSGGDKKIIKARSGFKRGERFFYLEAEGLLMVAASGSAAPLIARNASGCCSTPRLRVLAALGWFKVGWVPLAFCQAKPCVHFWTEPFSPECINLSREGDFPVAEFRAYFVGSDGHIVRYEPIVCDDDAEAVAKAKLLADGIHAIEVWSGPRLVTRFKQEPARS